MVSPLKDYMDADVAYLLGLIIGRGTIYPSAGVRQIVIQFSYSLLEAQGISSRFNVEDASRLGLDDIRERLQELLETDVQKNTRAGGVDLVIRFMRNNMIWRNILVLTDEQVSFHYFRIPRIFFDDDLPVDWAREFVRGYADVAGNIRESNRYIDGRRRVRLDVLNYPTNWKLALDLCHLLQEKLGVPVQNITWGHPNMGRGFREHQLNVFAVPFLEVGFGLRYKHQILEEFAEDDMRHHSGSCSACYGIGSIRQKDSDPQESNTEKLPMELVGRHFNAYWQICRALGCERNRQGELDLGDLGQHDPEDPREQGDIAGARV